MKATELLNRLITAIAGALAGAVVGFALAWAIIIDLNRTRGITFLGLEFLGGLFLGGFLGFAAGSLLGHPRSPEES